MDNDSITAHLIKISEDIGSISAKLDSINTSLTKHTEDDDEYQEKTDQRVLALEDSQKKVRWIAVGAAAVLTGLFKLLGFVVENHK